MAQSINNSIPCMLDLKYLSSNWPVVVVPVGLFLRTFPCVVLYTIAAFFFLFKDMITRELL